MGVAFIAATALLLAVAAALHIPTPTGRRGPRRDAPAGGADRRVRAERHGRTSVALGHPEPVDLIGLATKAVEALGLVFAIRLSQRMGPSGSFTQRRLNP